MKNEGLGSVLAKVQPGRGLSHEFGVVIGWCHDRRERPAMLLIHFCA